MQQFRVGPETQRLTHREFFVEDAGSVFALNSNPDVMRFTGESLLGSLDAARCFIADYPDFDRVGYGRWACILKETQSIVGFCGLKYLPDIDEVDLGFRFLPTYWGRGLATEACSATLDFGFNTIGLARVVAFVMPENAASIRVLEKVGMQFDADFDYDGILTMRFVVNKPDA